MPDRPLAIHDIAGLQDKALLVDLGGDLDSQDYPVAVGEDAHLSIWIVGAGGARATESESGRGALAPPYSEDL